MRFERLWIVSSSSVLPTTYGFLYTQPSREILEHDCPSRIFEAEGTIAISMPLATLLSCDGGGRVPSTNPVVRAPPDLLKGDLPAVVFFFPQTNIHISTPDQITSTTVPIKPSPLHISHTASTIPSESAEMSIRSTILALLAISAAAHAYDCFPLVCIHPPSEYMSELTIL